MRDEQKHRHEMDKRVLAAMKNETTTGQWLGFAVVIMLIAATLIALKMGNPVIAGLFFTASAIGIIHKFIDGKKSSDEDE